MPDPVPHPRAAPAGGTVPGNPVRRAVLRLGQDIRWLVSNSDRGSVEERDARQVRRVRLYTAGSILMTIWIGAVIGVLISIVQPSWGTGSSAVVLVLLALAGTQVVLVATAGDDRQWREYAGSLGLVGVLLVGGVVLTFLATSGNDQVTLLTGFVIASYGALGGIRVTGVWLALLVLTGVVLHISGTGPLQTVLLLIAACALLWAFRISFWILDVVQELALGRQASAALAVVQERLRFSRDLHDVMGRHLSAIAVTSDLSATLARRGDDRAPEQMDRVRDLAHESLAEVRALVRGYRAIDLDTELAGSRSLLEAAGISVTVELDPSHLDAGHREAVAWVLREGVTNILRHSRATKVLVRSAPGLVELRNDGATTPRAEAGSGLTGLRERVAESGGEVRVHCEHGEFSLLTTFDGAAPAGRDDAAHHDPDHPHDTSPEARPR